MHLREWSVALPVLPPLPRFFRHKCAFPRMCCSSAEHLPHGLAGFSVANLRDRALAEREMEHLCASGVLRRVALPSSAADIVLVLPCDHDRWIAQQTTALAGAPTSEAARVMSAFGRWVVSESRVRSSVPMLGPAELRAIAADAQAMQSDDDRPHPEARVSSSTLSVSPAVRDGASSRSIMTTTASIPEPRVVQHLLRATAICRRQDTTAAREYLVCLPAAAEFQRSLIRMRREILRRVRASRFGEVSRAQLCDPRGALARIASSSPLTVDAHIDDLLGRAWLKLLATASGPVLTLGPAAPPMS